MRAANSQVKQSKAVFHRSSRVWGFFWFKSHVYILISPWQKCIIIIRNHLYESMSEFKERIKSFFCFIVTCPEYLRWQQFLLLHYWYRKNVELERHAQATTSIFPPSIPVYVYIQRCTVTLYRLQGTGISPWTANSPASTAGLEQRQ